MKRVPIDEFEIEAKEKKEDFRLEVFSLFDGSPLSLPCGLISSGMKRKVCILSGQHGNEWNGVFASQQYFRRLNPEKIHGSLIILPIANPLAFNERARVSNVDDVDLNRTYLKKTATKPTEYLGKILFEELFSKMDYIIDIHTGGPGEYMPHVTVPNEEEIEKASRFLLRTIFVEPKTNGTLAAASDEREFSNFTIEAGKQRDLNEDYIDLILAGLDNFLKHVKFLEGKSERNDVEIYRNKEKVPSPVSGFFKSEVELGDHVEKGEKVGVVTKVFGEKAEVESPTSGLVLYLRREEVVGRGEKLLHILN